MQFIIAAVFWILGLVIGSMGLLQIMIILFFSIPYTKKLSCFGLIKSTSIIYKANLITISIWIIIIGGVSTLVFLYTSKVSLITYLVGIGIAILMGLSKTGTNDNNVQDYFTTNYRSINLDGIKNVNEKTGTMILDCLDKVYKENGINNKLIKVIYNIFF